MERREGPEGAHHGRCRRHGSHRALAVNPCWRKPSPDVVCDFTGFMAEPMKEIMKEIVDKAKKKKKGGGGSFQDIDLGEILELIDSTREEFTEGD